MFKLLRAPWLAAALLAVGGASSAHAQTEPIVFVSGMDGHPGQFATMASRLVAEGYPVAKLYAFTYSSALTGTAASARELAAFVRLVRGQNGNARVAVVAQGTGGLVARWYLVHEDGAGATRRFVSLGTPHAGTPAGQACHSPVCYDIRPGSLFLMNLAGKGCDRTLWSSADAVTLPASSGRCGTSVEVPGVAASAWLTDAKAYAAVRAALR